MENEKHLEMECREGFAYCDDGLATVHGFTVGKSSSGVELLSCYAADRSIDITYIILLRVYARLFRTPQQTKEETPVAEECPRTACLDQGIHCRYSSSKASGCYDIDAQHCAH
jgi:hypothetical protein